MTQINSMTGFAASSGALAPYSWTWELRSVNSKGLDLRLRVPDWIDGLEIALRQQLSGAVARGNVTLSLRLGRDDEAVAPQLNPVTMRSALDALAEVEAQALERGLSLAPSTAAQLLAMRGMFEPGTVAEDTAPLAAALREAFPELVAAFTDMRAREGAALAQVLSGQLTQIADLNARASAMTESRRQGMEDTLRTNLARVLENATGADADRVAQELALIAVKSDITEELDRLAAHIAAARDLLQKGGPVGRKLDFLMQEFNREANTICSKSQWSDLTAIGLEMKAIIDQMREQVQNVE